MGKNETQPAPLSLALPILHGAADEDREELVDLWARLFASAMDPATRNNVRHEFIAAVNEMDPLDAGIMHYIHSAKLGRIRTDGHADLVMFQNVTEANVEYISQQLGYRNDDVELSVEHLVSLGFLVSGPIIERNVWLSGPKLREFMLGCYPELSP